MENEILDSMLKVVYFVDDENKEPYLVHCEVEDGYCVLGLKDYPDTPQDFETPRELVRRFPTREEEIIAKIKIAKKLNK